MTNHKDIRAKIIDVLENHITSVQKVYKSRQSNYDGFPAAIVQVSSTEPEWHATDNDKKTYIFDIAIYTPIEGQVDHDEAEDVLIDVMDEFDTLFTSRKVLGNVVDFLTPSAWSTAYDSSGENMYRVAELRLMCVKHVNLQTLEQGS